MIKYKLICKDCDISFDSWFSSSGEYEKLKKKNFLTCHLCNSLNVEKTLMAPSVFSSKNNIKIDNKKAKYVKIKKIILRLTTELKNVKKQLKQYQNTKNLLKKILIMLVKILLMKQDLFIIKIKKFQKEFMEQQQKRTLRSLRKKA